MKHLLCASIRTMTYDWQLSGQASGFWPSWLPPWCRKPSRIHLKSQKLTTTLPHPSLPEHVNNVDAHTILMIKSVFSASPTPGPDPAPMSISSELWNLGRITCFLQGSFSSLVQWVCNSNTQLVGLGWRINKVALDRCLSWLDRGPLYHKVAGQISSQGIPRL